VSPTIDPSPHSRGAGLAQGREEHLEVDEEAHGNEEDRDELCLAHDLERVVAPRSAKRLLQGDTPPTALMGPALAVGYDSSLVDFPCAATSFTALRSKETSVSAPSQLPS